MSAISDLDWREIREHYDLRHSIHKQLLELMEREERNGLAGVPSVPISVGAVDFRP
jgi:hypothetical protein